MTNIFAQSEHKYKRNVRPQPNDIKINLRHNRTMARKKKSENWDSMTDTRPIQSDRPMHYLLDWCLDRKVTQAKMAEVIGVSPGHMSDLVKYKKELSLILARQAADYLRIPIGWLLDYKPSEVPARDVAEVWQRLSERSQEIALKQLEVFADNDRDV